MSAKFLALVNALPGVFRPLPAVQGRVQFCVSLSRRLLSALLDEIDGRMLNSATFGTTFASLGTEIGQFNDG